MKIKVFSLIFLICLFSCKNTKNEKMEVLQGYISWQQKDWSSAILHFFNAQEISKTCGDMKNIEYIYYAQASTYLMQNELEPAYDKLKMIEETEDTHLASSVFYQLGIISFKMGEYNDATQYFKKSLEKESDNIDAKINYELSKREIEEEKIRKARSTYLIEENSDQSYNTLIDIFKKREIEEWTEKKQSGEESQIFDY